MSNCIECCCDCEETTLTYDKTKGEAYYSQVTAKTKDGGTIDNSTISAVEFVLYDFDNVEKYKKEYLYDEPLKKWTLTVPTITTKDWGAGTSKYKVWFTFADGNKVVILQGLFKIKE